MEKYPHFTPAQVKQYLIDEATDGVIDMSVIREDKGANKLLYVGKNGTHVVMHLRMHYTRAYTYVRVH